MLERAWPRSDAVVDSRRIPSSMERAWRRFQEVRMEPSRRLLEGAGSVSGSGSGSVGGAVLVVGWWGGVGLSGVCVREVVSMLIIPSWGGVGVVTVRVLLFCRNMLEMAALAAVVAAGPS